MINPDSPDEMASGQLRAPIPLVRSSTYAGLGNRTLTDPTGERRNQQFRRHFRGFRSCWPNPSGESGIKALPKGLRDLAEPIERALAQVRAVVEHPFHIVKNLFRHKKLRYRGLKKNTAQLHTLFALANLVIVKKTLLAQQYRA